MALSIMLRRGFGVWARITIRAHRGFVGGYLTRRFSPDDARATTRSSRSPALSPARFDRGLDRDWSRFLR
jgi:hypothetical protein